MQKERFLRTAYAFLSAARHHAGGGLLLMLAAAAALLVANSPLASSYEAFWQQPVSLRLGRFDLFAHGGEPLSLLGFINDALMAVFFLMVGLEIKRELLVGQLSSPRRALLPVVAAVGGMAVPVLLFSLLAHGTPAAAGRAIPMATDVAFSLGVLGLFGSRVPLSLKVFLTAFAVVDDIGGILVIALFYAGHLSLPHLLAAGCVAAVLVLAGWAGVRRRWFYLALGVVLWYLFLQSGVHATIAGVVLAFTVPATPSPAASRYVDRIRRGARLLARGGSAGALLDKEQLDLLKSIESASDRAISPLQALEDALHRPVNYFIMPLFAFANAGVALAGPAGGPAVGRLALAVFVGLVAGKFLGILLFTLLAVRLRLASMPEGMTRGGLCAVALLGGIGFTVSLFIAQLSFGSAPALLAEAKLGVLLGTLVAGLLGVAVLRVALRKGTAAGR